MRLREREFSRKIKTNKLYKQNYLKISLLYILMKGLIYSITGYGLTYYGSTIQNLNDRKLSHKSTYKNRDKRYLCKSSLILQHGDDWTIQPIEELEFDDIDDLRHKEYEYMKNNECVNKYILKTDDELREYKRVWAEKNRRAKGCKLKTEMTLTKDPDYSAKWSRNKRATESPEEKEARLKARREAYAKKPQTEEQKEKAKERARLQRERKRLGTSQ
jgi:hypothetical protein